MNAKTFADSLAFVACLTALPLGATCWSAPAGAQAYRWPLPARTITALPAMPTGTAVVARDGGAGLRFGNEAVFTFGDTALSRPNSTGSQWVVNSMYHTRDLDASNGIAGGYNYRTFGYPALQWLGYTQAEIDQNAVWAQESAQNHTPLKQVGLWPTSGMRIGNAQYLWFGKVIETAGGGIEGLGAGFVQVTSATAPTTRITHRPEATDGEPEIVFTAEEGGYGNAVAVSGNLVFAYWGSTEAWDWGNVRLAFARTDDGPDADSSPDCFLRSNWWFYDADAPFGATQDAAAATILFADGAQGSVEWNPYLNGWVYTYLGVFSSKVRMRFADQPYGPWSEPVDVIDAKLGSQGELPYFAKAQKILEQENGRTMYVTYSVGGAIGTGSGVNMVKLRFQ
ncbi:MAG TPA: DUF4185 domain-containing protein [Polyangiales bacterium]|nr:DUF4185 domain-containing protein [Polyangiales bacterium]